MGTLIIGIVGLLGGALAGEAEELEALSEEPEAVSEWGAWVVPGTSEFKCSDGPVTVVDAEDAANAEAVVPLDQDQVDWLRPKLSRLPANPRAQRSYSAYALEPGEFELGLMTSAGVIRGVQIGSNLVLNGLGVYNGEVKINAVQAGPVDMAIIGSRYQLYQDRYKASFTGVGAVTSIQVLKPWSLHLGGDYYQLKSSGLVDLDAISPFLSGPVDEAVDTIATEGYDDLDIFASVIRVRGATDVRFNRRDSIVLQFSAFVHARLQTELPEIGFIPDIASIQDALSYDGYVPVSETYMTSVAWQFAWKRAELRVGGGISSVPGAWLMQSTEFNYKLGGASRRREYRMRATWRDNKRDARDWNSGAVVDEGPGAPAGFDDGPVGAPDGAPAGDGAPAEVPTSPEDDAVSDVSPS